MLYSRARGVREASSGQRLAVQVRPNHSVFLLHSQPVSPGCQLRLDLPTVELLLLLLLLLLLELMLELLLDSLDGEVLPRQEAAQVPHVRHQLGVLHPVVDVRDEHLQRGCRCRCGCRLACFGKAQNPKKK